MIRIFEIEFPDELGELWMNVDNLMLCINAYVDNTGGRIEATDVTDDVKGIRHVMYPHWRRPSRNRPKALSGSVTILC